MPFWRLSLVPQLGGPAAVLIGWLAVVLLSRADRRPPAATVASVLLALTLVNLLAVVLHWAGLSAGFGFPSVIYLVSRSVLAGPASSVLSVLAIVAAVAITRVRGAAGGWVAVLLATAILVYLAPFASDLTANLLLLFGSLLVAVIVWPAAIRAGRRSS